ncbi:MAG: hypothetical protein EGR73_01140, partial [Lachnospiraceae bacterium]|nr:hypothetical protein [Lachnospiraceae bacterium]
NHCTFYTSFRSAQNHCPLDNVCPRGAFISVGDYTPTEKDLECYYSLAEVGVFSTEIKDKNHKTGGAVR